MAGIAPCSRFYSPRGATPDIPHPTRTRDAIEWRTCDLTSRERGVRLAGQTHIGRGTSSISTGLREPVQREDVMVISLDRMRKRGLSLTLAERVYGNAPKRGQMLGRIMVIGAGAYFIAAVLLQVFS